MLALLGGGKNRCLRFARFLKHLTLSRPFFKKRTKLSCFLHWSGLILDVLFVLLLLLLVTRPLPRDRGMAEDHGAPEAEQLPKVWSRGRKETESCQRVSGVKSP